MTKQDKIQVAQTIVTRLICDRVDKETTVENQLKIIAGAKIRIRSAKDRIKEINRQLRKAQRKLTKLENSK